MVENKSSLFGIIALIISASGLGLGVTSFVNFQTVEGPQGPPGDDGQDGTDGEDGEDLFGLKVGILEPDHNEVVSELVEIRIILWNSSKCSINVFINGSLTATTVPWEWDTTIVSDGWYNVSVRAMDIESKIAQDDVIVYVLNNPSPTPRARVYLSSGYYIEQAIINFDVKSYDSTDSFDLTTDRYVIPENGYYLLTASATIYIESPPNAGEFAVLVEWTMIGYIRFTETTNSFVSLSITDIAYYSEGDWISVFVGLSNGNEYLYYGSEATYFSITKLSD